MQISKIAKAWIKVAKQETTKENRERADICKDCPSAIYKKFLDFVNDELKEVQGLVCSDCGCPLIAKIRSTDKCYKWKK